MTEAVPLKEGADIDPNKTVGCGSFPGPPWPVFIVPLLGKSRMIYKRRSCGIPRWMLMWCVPAALAGFGFLLQNWQLRIATHNYVHVMLQYTLQTNYTPTVQEGLKDIPLTMGFGPQNMSYGSLQDPVVAKLGPVLDESTSFLDILALIFPVGFVALAILTDCPSAWARIMISYFLLAFGKGLLGWITIEPASDGWQKCQDRLAANYGVEWYAQERSYWELFWMNPISRLCADMMYSGHTFTVTIFAFGTFGATRDAMRTQSQSCRAAAEWAVALAAIAEQSIEIYFVLRSRFHYTADVVMALFATYFVYTNGAVAVMTKWWVSLTEEETEELCKEYNVPSLKWLGVLNSQGRVALPCICGGSDAHIYSANEVQVMMDTLQKLDLKDGGKEPSDLERAIIQNAMMLPYQRGKDDQAKLN